MSRPRRPSRTSASWESANAGQSGIEPRQGGGVGVGDGGADFLPERPHAARQNVGVPLGRVFGLGGRLVSGKDGQQLLVVEIEALVARPTVLSTAARPASQSMSVP